MTYTRFMKIVQSPKDTAKRKTELKCKSFESDNKCTCYDGNGYCRYYGRQCEFPQTPCEIDGVKS